MATATENPTPEAIENGEGMTAEEIADNSIVTIPSVDLEKAQSDLDDLTQQAKAALADEGEAYFRAARALARIRDEKLVEALNTEADGTVTKTFEDYCRETFSLTRDAGDKAVRAALIFDAIVGDLSEQERKELPLPTSEGQLRSMGRMITAFQKNNPDLKKGTFGKVWKEAVVTAASKKGSGLLDRPTAEDVRQAIVKKAAKFAPAKPSSSTPKQPAPQTGREVFPSENPDEVEAKLASIIGAYTEVPVATLRAILIDGAKLGQKATAAVIGETFDTLLTPPAKGEGEGEEEQAA